MGTFDSALDSVFPSDNETEQGMLVEGVEIRKRSGDGRRMFWDSVAAGHWEPQTFRVFRRFLCPTSSCIDFGAWIGPTVLYAAHLSHHVHAIEPDPVAYAEPAANVAANPTLRDRITLYSQCIAPQSGPISLYAGGIYHTANSRFGDSMSGIVPTPGYPEQPSHSVEGIRLEDFMAANAIADCGFIKMDIEGGEYSLIPGHWRRLAAHGMPTLYVSFHAPIPARRDALIGDCMEELHSCYKWLYSAIDQRELNFPQLLPKVLDWTDESPGSAWRELEWLLFNGVVASNGAW